MLIREQRLRRAADEMRRQDVDLWISLGRELMHNGDAMLRYALTMDVFGPVALVLTRDGGRIVILRPGEAEEPERTGLFTAVVRNPEGMDGIRSFVADLVRTHRPRRIALNYSAKDPTADGLSHTGHLLLTEAFAAGGFRGEIVSSQNLMKAVRAGRSAEEIEKIRHAVQCAMEIYEQARPFMKKGMSGMDIQRLYQGIADRNGYEYAWSKYGNPFNSIGTRSSYLCKRPADDVFIEPGDVVNVDFGIRVDGFASDNQRTFYALRDGESAPPAEVRRAFDTLGEVNRAVAARMKPGVKSGELLRYANDILAENGYPQRAGGLGHELGIFAHDGVLSPGSSACEPDIDSTLIEGMTFTLEPDILTSCGRVCREEVVAVTAEGGRILSTLQDDIWLIP